MYINIHSHHPGQPDALTIQSLYKDFDQSLTSGNYSLGLHPWHILDTTWKKEWEKIKSLSSHPQVLAIGECGLDKLCTTNWQLQEDVFSTQLSWADEINKPVIIHCVRAYEEILSAIRRAGSGTPCIFHGFNRNLAIAGQIIKDGHYISLGKALSSPALQAVLAAIPAENYFLETDDATIPIRKIYELAAEARKETVETIILQVSKNFEKVFTFSQTA